MSKLKLSFFGPQANGLSSILWLVKNVPFFSIISPMISYFEHGQFTLAQSTESLRIGLQALKSLSFGRKLVSSKYQTSRNIASLSCGRKLSQLQVSNSRNSL